MRATQRCGAEAVRRAEVRRARTVKRVERSKKWMRSYNENRERLLGTIVEHEELIRMHILDTLAHSKRVSKCFLLAAGYQVVGGRPAGHAARKRLRADIEVVLGKLYLEGRVYLTEEITDVPGREPRLISMIYLRPTNDIPIDRLAASVIGPVWGSKT